MKRMALLLFVVATVIPGELRAQWYQQSFPWDDYLWKVSFADQNTGWIVGSSNVYRTTDGGGTWTIQNATGGACFALMAIDQNTAVYAPYASGIHRTSDGGQTWALVDSTPVNYFDFEFISPTVGYAAGGTNPDNNSILRKTTDGGATWSTVSIIPQVTLGEFEAISFVSEAMGWGITYGGTIYRTTDSGVSWSISDSSGGNSNMRDIDFIDADLGWAVGGISSTMRVWRTTDGGGSWIKEEQPGSSLREITMRSAEMGWFVGISNGPPFLGRTDDGGVTWVTQDLIPYYNDGFESFSFVDDNIGWAVTCCGRVFKTTNGGLTGVSDGPDLPGTFSLQQNYPNPFNAQTEIRFQIAHYGLVTLAIYDLLGREVTTLVNEPKDAGLHSVSWDAARQPSGVYCYRLQAGGYVETKRLVLLR